MADNVDYAYQFFISKGWSPQAAAAIVGHFQQESGKDLNAKAIHDSGTGFGIAGWRDDPRPGGGKRKTALMIFAEDNGMDPNDLETQLEFTDYELLNSESSVGRKLNRAKTVDEAAEVFTGFERPRGYTPKNPRAAHGFKNRLENARSVFTSYTGNEAVASSDMEAPQQDDDLTGVYSPDDEPTDTTFSEDTADDWSDDSLEQSADAAVSEGADWKGRAKGAIAGAIAGSGSKSNEPFDYTPAGEGIDVNIDPELGAVPIYDYSRYVGYSRGGNVEKDINPNDYFRQVLGGK